MSSEAVHASVLIKKLPSRPMASNAEFEPFWWYEEMATAVSGRSKRVSPLQVLARATPKT
jgi:hypothetical protein